MVLVKKGGDMDYGDIGAFIIGNETYIKEYAEDGLHSLNKKYPTMTFCEEEKVFSIGKVVSVLDPELIATETDAKKYVAVHGE